MKPAIFVTRDISLEHPMLKVKHSGVLVPPWATDMDFCVPPVSPAKYPPDPIGCAEIAVVEPEYVAGNVGRQVSDVLFVLVPHPGNIDGSGICVMR